jgi:hypothetical protein
MRHSRQAHEQLGIQLKQTDNPAISLLGSNMQADRARHKHFQDKHEHHPE